MSFYRLAGALLLALSGVGGALLMNRRVAAELEQVEAWVSLVGYIHAQVDCFSLPLPRILGRCEPALLRACGYRGDRVPDSLSALLRESGLRDAESRRCLARFAEEFGRGYREEQLRQCEGAMRVLLARRDALAAQLPGKRRLNSTLWISGTLALVILLI